MNEVKKLIACLKKRDCYDDDNTASYIKKMFKMNLPTYDFNNIKLVYCEENYAEIALFSINDILLGVQLDESYWFLVDRILVSARNIITYCSEDNDDVIKLFEYSDNTISYDLYPFRQGYEIPIEAINDEYKKVKKIEGLYVDNIKIKDKLLKKTIDEYIKNTDYDLSKQYVIYKWLNNMEICIGKLMIFVRKGDEIISGFFDLIDFFQSGDSHNQAYLADNGDFIYCCYGDITSTAIIKINDVHN
jgi:hypothetical protein